MAEVIADDYLDIDTHFGKVHIQPGDVYMIDDELNKLDQVKRDVVAKDGTITTLYANFTLTEVPPA